MGSVTPHEVDKTKLCALGQVITGGVLSTLFTLKEQVVVLLEASREVSVTTVVPVLNTLDPLKGFCSKVTALQISELVASVV